MSRLQQNVRIPQPLDQRAPPQNIGLRAAQAAWSQASAASTRPKHEADTSCPSRITENAGIGTGRTPPCTQHRPPPDIRIRRRGSRKLSQGFQPQFTGHQHIFHVNADQTRDCRIHIDPRPHQVEIDTAGQELLAIVFDDQPQRGFQGVVALLIHTLIVAGVQAGPNDALVCRRPTYRQRQCSQSTQRAQSSQDRVTDLARSRQASRMDSNPKFFLCDLRVLRGLRDS